MAKWREWSEDPQYGRPHSLPAYAKPRSGRNEVGMGMSQIGLSKPRPISATKKPVTIKAIQWNGVNGEDVIDFCRFGEYNEISNAYVDHTGSLIISTLEGDMLAIMGSYIIHGVDGEFYPCKESIFYKTYDIKT
jgi:hypothetical protein